MASKLQNVMKEVEKLSDALDIDKDEFGQRAMRTSILSTSYRTTEDAVDKSKIQYRRGLSLKAGIAVAEVFETLPDQNEGQLPFDEFIDRTTTAYMRITGMPASDAYTRYSEVKGIVMSKLARSIDLGQITRLEKNGVKLVKIIPEVGSTTFAMLMNPETMLRSPYVKAMAQTIGGMAIVDGEPSKITKAELSSTVQDKLHTADLLQITKTPAVFNAQNIEPFHQHNKVPFYSEVDDKLFILPTFPAPGNQPDAVSGLPALASRELAFTLLPYTDLNDLVNGFNPPLTTFRSGGVEFYYNRHFRYVQDLAELLGTSLSKYLPRNEGVFRALDELQSRLGPEFGDGVKVASIIRRIRDENPKDADLQGLEKRIVGLLFLKLGLIFRTPEGVYKAKDGPSRTILKSLEALCNVISPTGLVLSRMATREGE
jgi:hypothetical protein